MQRTHYSDAAPGRNTNNHEVDGLRHRASGYGAWLEVDVQAITKEVVVGPAEWRGGQLNGVAGERC